MKQSFLNTLQNEIERIDKSNTSKRNEKIIEGFTDDYKAIINGTNYLVFNSNDYLGLRFHKDVKQAEHEASEKYGAGPGAVRFISGTSRVYIDLEKKLADFHDREAAMVFSSAFATNLAVIFCLLKGQSKDSLVSGDALVISDGLNHRSIIDGIRVANLPSENKAIYNHLDYSHLDSILKENAAKFKRVVVITDGVFSMLGEHADLKKIRSVIDKNMDHYDEGIVFVVDDSHGVGAFGKKGRGCEEACDTQCDVLIGTMGKAFGADGGYVVSNKTVIDYLRESAATYIYSNSISPSVAGAALKSLEIIDSEEGEKLLARVQANIKKFKEAIQSIGLVLASDSHHPIQPILIGETQRARMFSQELFKRNILVTTISYPVVPPGKDEIRVQLSALHSAEDIGAIVEACSEIKKKLGSRKLD